MTVTDNERDTFRPTVDRGQKTGTEDRTALVDRRRLLSRELAAKGISTAETTTSAIKDEDLEKALALVAGFDVSKGLGLLVHMLRAGDFGKQAAPSPPTRSERYWAKVSELETTFGFNKRQAELSALTAITMEALGTRPTKARLLARLKVQYPWALDDEAAA